MNKYATRDVHRYARVLAWLIARGHAVKIRSKSESLLMRIVGTLLFFNPAFMRDYTTTIGNTVYFPDGFVDRDPGTAWGVLAHEGMHLEQFRRVGPIKFSLAYLFPAPLALLALGAFWSPWFLLAMVFLAPLPAPWRVKWEREAYLVTAVCDAARGWDITEDWYIDFQVECYCGWGYYKPAWNRKKIRERVRHDMVLALEIYHGKVVDNYITGILTQVKA